MKVAVTGANGFVGAALVRRLAADGHEVSACVRVLPSGGAERWPGGTRVVAVGDIHGSTDWTCALEGVSVVVHAAARVHVMRETADDALSAFRQVNVAGTVNLARQAAAAGVRRMVLISSVKVLGESTAQGRPFTEQDQPAPQDAYARSKLEAEEGLRQVSVETGMEWVMVRPPLVYGPGVRANFEAMMRWLQRGLPFPFGLVTENRRSLVGLDNLVDLLVVCTQHPNVPGHRLLVSDGDDLSTAELLTRLGRAMHRPARLLPVPLVCLKWGAAVMGRRAMAQRLLGSLEVDIAATQRVTGWCPAVPVEEGLRRAAIRDIS